MARRHYFTTLDDAELDKLGGSCREYTVPRDIAASTVRGWIRGNTKIGPAWRWQSVIIKAVAGIEITIESLFGDGTSSWVVIVNGTNKYVTELTEETQDDHIDYVGECTGKPVAKARPKQTSMATTSSSTATLPHHLRVWIEGGTRSVRQELFRSVKKKRKSGCFDTILQHPEKKTEQSNSEFWHRCFVQNLRLLTLSYLQKRRRTKEETRVLCGSTLC